MMLEERIRKMLTDHFQDCNRTANLNERDKTHEQYTNKILAAIKEAGYLSRAEWNAHVDGVG